MNPPPSLEGGNPTQGRLRPRGQQLEGCSERAAKGSGSASSAEGLQTHRGHPVPAGHFPLPAFSSPERPSRTEIQLQRGWGFFCQVRHLCAAGPGAGALCGDTGDRATLSVPTTGWALPPARTGDDPERGPIWEAETKHPASDPRSPAALPRGHRPGRHFRGRLGKAPAFRQPLGTGKKLNSKPNK